MDCSLKEVFPKLYSISQARESSMWSCTSLMGGFIGTFSFDV